MDHNLNEILRNAGVPTTAEARAGAAAVARVMAPLAAPPQSGRMHLDRHVGDLIDRGAREGNGDDLIDGNELATWLRVSPQWVALQRKRGTGPAYVRVTGNQILYRRDAVLAWLREREHRSTAEYHTGELGRSGRKPKRREAAT